MQVRFAENNTIKHAERGDGRMECNLHPEASKIDGKFFLSLFELVKIIKRFEYNTNVRREKEKKTDQ